MCRKPVASPNRLDASLGSGVATEADCRVRRPLARGRNPLPEAGVARYSQREDRCLDPIVFWFRAINSGERRSWRGVRENRFVALH